MFLGAKDCAPVAAELFRQRAITIRDDGASDRLQQNAIFVSDVLGKPDENAAGPIDCVRFNA